MKFFYFEITFGISGYIGMLGKQIFKRGSQGLIKLRQIFQVHGSPIILKIVSYSQIAFDKGGIGSSDVCHVFYHI